MGAGPRSQKFADKFAFIHVTRSFRFGEAVATAATSILKTLGETRLLIGDPNRDSKIAADGKTGTILCRTNAGVVAVVINALAENRKTHVVGGVAELINLLEDVTKLKRSIGAECPEFCGFNEWSEVLDFVKSDEGEALRSFVGIVNTYGENILIQKLRSVSHEEKGVSLIVSTGHKAKGREWDSVTLFSDFEPRLSKEIPPKQVLNQEEARLLYVATTRARELLVVPPGLAERWNVASAQAVDKNNFPILAVTPHKIQDALPQLPSFAKIVTPSSPEPLQAAVRETHQREMSPSNKELKRPSLTDVSPIAPPRFTYPSKQPAAKPSLLSLIFSLFTGKK